MSATQPHTTATAGGDPSMEDILASIRRILSEEDAPDMVASRPTATPSQAGSDHHADQQQDVLVLDDSMLVTDAPPPSEIAATPVHVPPVPVEAPAAVEMAATAEPPILAEPAVAAAPKDTAKDVHPAFSLSASLSARMVASPVLFPVPRGQPAALPTNAPAATSPRIQPPLAEPSTPQQETAPMSAATTAFPSTGLTSPETAAATAGSVTNLVRALTADRGAQVSSGGPTIADLVREEIRPVLKSWLDTNLPPLVERLVRAEIERVIARSVD